MSKTIYELIGNSGKIILMGDINTLIKYFKDNIYKSSVGLSGAIDYYCSTASISQDSFFTNDIYSQIEGNRLLLKAFCFAMGLNIRDHGIYQKAADFKISITKETFYSIESKLSILPSNSEKIFYLKTFLKENKFIFQDSSNFIKYIFSFYEKDIKQDIFSAIQYQAKFQLFLYDMIYDLEHSSLNKD